MKFIGALIFLVVVLAVSEGLPKQFAQKLCNAKEDCDWDQCCIDASTRIPGFHGICTNPTTRGEVCDSSSANLTPEGRYRFTCPCDKGLTCEVKEQGCEVHTCQ